MPSRYTFTPYSLEWPHEFEREEVRLHALLGNEIVTIHHIGSTSVPGLDAKPINEETKVGLAETYVIALRKFCLFWTKPKRLMIWIFLAIDFIHSPANVKGTWSIRVTGNWRITFLFEDGNVLDVELEDYH